MLVVADSEAAAAGAVGVAMVRIVVPSHWTRVQYIVWVLGCSNVAAGRRRRRREVKVLVMVMILVGVDAIVTAVQLLLVVQA